MIPDHLLASAKMAIAYENWLLVQGCSCRPVIWHDMVMRGRQVVTLMIRTDLRAAPPPLG